MPPKKTYTKIDVGLVRAGVEGGLSARQIAEAHGYTTSGVTKAARRIKKPKARKTGSGRKPKANIQELEETAAADPQISVTELAHKAEISKTAARRSLRVEIGDGYVGSSAV